jgi:alpha-mannosidase
MRFALEHQNPFVTGVINPTSPTLPGDRYSLLSISDPDILLWAFKPADDDAGKTVARLWNVSSMNHSALLSFNNHRISDAQVISHIETPEGNVVPDDLGALPMRFTPQQMRSYMLKLERTGSIQNA